MTSYPGIDQAVAQAVQNLQSLQKMRVEMYSDLGFPTVPDPLPVVPPPPPPPPRPALLSEDLTTVCVGLLPKPVPVTSSDPLALERAARLYRSAASVCQANCTWSGQLPHRSSTAAPHSSYSTKIFLGGVPWDISEQTLVQAFAEFGNVRVEWPGRDFTSPPKGYLYLVFEDESDIKDLLAKCSQDFATRDSYYYKISSRRMRAKVVYHRSCVYYFRSVFMLNSCRKFKSSHGFSPTPTTSAASLRGWTLRRLCSWARCTA